MTSHCSRSSLCSVPFILLCPHKHSLHGWVHMSRLCAFHIWLVSDITKHSFRESSRAFMCSFHCKIWSICGNLYQVKIPSLPSVCLMFKLLEAVQWTCKMSVLPTKASDLPGNHLMLWYSGKLCIHNKGSLTCFETKSVLKWNLSCRKQDLSTYITVEKKPWNIPTTWSVI